MKKRPQPDPNSVKGLTSQGRLEKYHELPTELIMWWFKVYTIQFYDSKGKCGFKIFGQFLKHTSGISDFYIFLLLGCDTLPSAHPFIHPRCPMMPWWPSFWALPQQSWTMCHWWQRLRECHSDEANDCVSGGGGWCPHVHFMSWGDWGTNWMPTQHLNCR